MPTLTNSVPKYRKHKASGQAIVTFHGRDFYLGPYGTQASRIEYDRLVAEWLAAGRQAPVEQDAITVVEVIQQYLRFSKRHFRKNGKLTTSHSSTKSALRYLTDLYGKTSAIEFGPKRLKALRMQMEQPRSQEELADAENKNRPKKRRICRQTVNKHIAAIKRVFRWAAAEELIPASVPQSLSMVRGLERGRSEAPESKPVRSVPESVVDATLNFLPEVVADMVRIQLLTGMRPSEVCSVCPRDLDQSGPVWLFRPAEHKTEHHGHTRVVAIGPRGQDVLRKYLLRAEDAYCFTPADSEKKRRRDRTAARVIPAGYGNQPGTNRKKSPKRKAGNRYTADSYRRAVHRAAERAGVERWSPNQLRHSAATRIRSEFGLEEAQVSLGHSRANITEVYAERDLRKAIEVAKRIG